MADEPILLLAAASRLAHGDDDFTSYLTPIGDTVEIAPGVVGAGSWGDPESDREMNRLIEFAKAGKLTILAWRYGDKSGKFEPIPREFWRWNNWVVATNPPHEICKSYDPESKRGGSETAEWCNPHVCWSDVERLIGAAPAANAPPTQKPAEKRKAAIRDSLSQGVVPGRNMPWDMFIPDLMKRCGADSSTRGFGDRQIKRLAADMLQKQ
jgi:hypothetical protein